MTTGYEDTDVAAYILTFAALPVSGTGHLSLARARNGLTEVKGIRRVQADPSAEGGKGGIFNDLGPLTTPVWS